MKYPAEHQRDLVSRADLIYDCPPATPLEGQPVGNGAMGTMVWTSPGAVHFQLNRCDVFAVNRHHHRRQAEDTDYCGGCAQVTIELGGQPFQPTDAYAQRLSLYDAESTITGQDLTVRCFASAMCDILAIEIDDRRAAPQPVRLTLAMWRPPEVCTGDHTAQYRFTDSEDRVLLVQQFSQNDHYCSSAVAATVVGVEPRVEHTSQQSRTLVCPATAGRTIILLSTAASWSPQEDAGVTSFRVLDRAASASMDELRTEHRTWWADFWSRTYVRLSSADGVANAMEQVRTRHLYYMASSSRGALPPKWNGSIFITDGDHRLWGAQYWVWTTEMHYFPLFAADAVDLMTPYFDMYRAQLSRCEAAGLQRWGAQGAFYPETAAFDGPVILPDDVAIEYQDVLLGRKSALQLSDRARALGQYEAGLRVLACARDELAAGRYTWISHVMSSGCELAVQAWWRYRYSVDLKWLCSHGYPLLRGAVEFYRHLAERGADGLFHVYGTNVHEDFWGAHDGIWDLAAIRGTTPLAIRAAEILGVDATLRVQWQDLLDNLAPYPMGSDPQSRALTGAVLADDIWAAGHLGHVDGQHNPEDVWLNPIFPFEDWTLETGDAAADAIAHKAVKLAPRMQSILDGDTCNTAIRTPIAVARVGHGEDLPAVLASYYAAFAPLANGWSLFEGADQAHSIEPLGCITTAVQEGLLQSLSPAPGESEILSVFPAWPHAWDAEFRLLARGGFVVSSAIREGVVESVEIESRNGEGCLLRNLWGTPCRITATDGTEHELAGEVLCFATVAGASYHIVPVAPPAV
jgi:hypothetical protein